MPDTLAIDTSESQAHIEQLAKSVEHLSNLLGNNKDQSKKVSNGLEDVGTHARESGGALERLAEAAALAVWAELARKFLEIGRSLADSAVEAERHERALHALGSAYQGVQEATRDTVTAEQALRVQQALVQSGLHVSNEELAAITARAREYALATGTDTTEALDRLTQGLETGSARGLRPFGLHVQANEDRVHAFHRSLGTLEERQHHVVASSRTLGEEQALLGREFTHMTGTIGTAIAGALHLRDVMGTLAEAIRGVDEAITGTERHSVNQQFADNGAREVSADSYNQSLSSAARFVTGRIGAQRDLPNLPRADQLTASQQAEFTQRARHLGLDGESDDQLRQEVRTLTHDMVAAAGTTAHARVEAVAAAARANRGGEGAGEDIHEAAVASPSSSEHHNGLKEQESNRMEGAALLREAAEHLAQSVHEDWVAKDTLLRSLAHTNAEADNSEEEKRRQYAASQRAPGSDERSGNAGHALEDRLNAGGVSHGLTEMHDGIMSLVPAATQMAEGVGSAFDAMGQSMTKNLQAFAEGKEGFGDAMASIAKDTLSSIEAQCIPKGLMAILDGTVRALTSYGMDPTSEGLLASGAAYLAVGFGALGLSALTSGGGASKPSTGGGAPASSGSPFGGSSAQGPGGGSGGGSGAVIYNVNISGVMSNEQTAGVMGRSIQGLAQRQALPNTMDSWR